MKAEQRVIKKTFDSEETLITSLEPDMPVCGKRVKPPVWQECCYRLLAALDKACSEHKIEYFAFSSMLEHCVHYQAICPESAEKYEIGMLRADYERFVDVMAYKSEDYGFILDAFLLDGITPRRKARVGVWFEAQSELMQAAGWYWIELSPFDAVPEPFDLRCAHLRKMRRLNKKFDRINSCKIGKRSYSLPREVAKKILYGGRSLSKCYTELLKTAVRYNEKSHKYIMRSVVSPSKMVELEQVFPLQRRPFGPVMLPCPCECTIWTTLQDDVFRARVEAIQRVDLELLEEFDRVCKKVGVGYFVCGGTMLGYIRHGGFIPWDDDIDVGMLRKDYDTFLEKAGPLLSKGFFLQTRGKDRKIPYLFSKIRKDNTAYITSYNENRDYHKGICLDIFPFDYIPKDQRAQNRFRSQVRFYERIHNFVVNRQVRDPDEKVKPFGARDRFARAFGYLKRRSFALIPLWLTQALYIRKATQYNKKAQRMGLDTVASFVPSYTYIKLEDLLPYRDIMFEGVPAKVPRAPEVFLTMQYGDFMRLPPKHKQAGHDLIRWSVDCAEGGTDVTDIHSEEE